MSEASEKIIVTCPTCDRHHTVASSLTGRLASCPCGAKFRIEAPTDAPQSAVATSTSPRCSNHAEMPAEYACARCRALVCSTCDFPQSDGSHLCPRCAAGVTSAARGDPDFSAFGGTSAPGVNCRFHPEVPASARCRACGAPVCVTCDFVFPGGVHCCPTCATATSRPLGSSRKALVGWSLAAAAWVTVMLALLLLGTFAEFVESPGGDMLIGMLILVPGLAGTGLAFGSLDRRAGNPPIVWVTVIWNSITLAVWLALCVIGAFMMGSGGM